MKKIKIMMTAMALSLLGISQAFAAENAGDKSMITDFAHVIAEQDTEYAMWSNAEPSFAYELYGQNLTTVVANLYYIKASGVNAGYAIINAFGDTVIEFSLGAPAYDRFAAKGSRNLTSVKYIYSNAMPAIYEDGMYLDLNMNGEVESGMFPRYNPQEQGGANCIVGAISNLMWHWSSNGYSSLASGLTFKGVVDKVDTLILAEGGYANVNIPNTIKNYVKSKNSSYSATVTNTSNPTFSKVQSEVVTRPCLLGFAAGSPYSSSVGHMTVCVGTRTAAGVSYTKLMDGWSTSVVEKQWGNYNDFMTKVVMSK